MSSDGAKAFQVCVQSVFQSLQGSKQVSQWGIQLLCINYTPVPLGLPEALLKLQSGVNWLKAFGSVFPVLFVARVLESPVAVASSLSTHRRSEEKGKEEIASIGNLWFMITGNFIYIMGQVIPNFMKRGK